MGGRSASPASPSAIAATWSNSATRKTKPGKAESAQSARLAEPVRLLCAQYPNNSRNKPWNVVCLSLNGWRPPQLAQSLARDGANRHSANAIEWKFDPGGTGSLGQVCHARRTGERRGVDAPGKGAAKLLRCRFRHHVPVRIHHIHHRAGRAECAGNDVAGDCCPCQQNMLICNSICERAHKAFGDIVLGNQRYSHAHALRRLSRGLADSRNMKRLRRQRNFEAGRAFRKHPNRIRAREDEPIVAVKMKQSLIEWVEALRRFDFEYWNLDWLGTGGAQAFAEFSSLMRGAGHEHAAA